MGRTGLHRRESGKGAPTGFHDTILLLVLLSLVGLSLTKLLRDAPTTQLTIQDAATSHKQTIERATVEADV